MSTNNTTILTASWGQTKVVLFAVFLIVISVLAILGNILVILVVLRTKDLRRRESNYFLVSLSIADLLVGVAIIPTSVASLVNPLVLYNNTGVKVFLGFGNFSFCICSIMNLTLLSLDRYFAILFPYRYLELLTHKRACILCVMSWVYSMVFSLPPAFGVSSYSCFIPNLDVCYKEVWQSYVTSIFAFFVLGLTYVLSLIAMGLSYWKIFKVTRMHSRQIAAQHKLEIVTNNNQSLGNTTPRRSQDEEEIRRRPSAATSDDAQTVNCKDEPSKNLHLSHCSAENEHSTGPSIITAWYEKQKHNHPARKLKSKNVKNTKKSSFHNAKCEIRVARSFLTLIGFYFLCWTPFCLILMAELVVRTKLTEEGSLICLWIGYVNSCLNPFIHTWKYKQFRKALIKFLKEVRSTLRAKKICC